jgi:capsid protein
METYLSDTLRKQVFKRNAVLRRFVKSHDEFKNSKKDPVSEIFTTYDKLNELVNKAIDGLSFHNIVTAKKLYNDVLATSFPDDIRELIKAVETRHDIVHRNGRDLQNNAVTMTMSEVQAIAQLVDDTVNYIDKQVKDGLLDHDEFDNCNENSHSNLG